MKGSLRDPFKGMEVQDLITAYVEKVGPVKGWARSKDYVLERLKNDPMIGKIRVSAFSRLHVSQFVTERMKTAQGSTIAGDLDFLAGVFKWARDVRLLNVNPELIYAERRSLPHRGLKTKSNKRDRVATRDELQRIARYFDENLRIRLPMTSIVHFASISTLRQDEICKLQIEDVNFNKLEMLVRDRKDPEEKLNNNSLVPILKPMYGILKKAIGNRSSGPVFTWTLKKTGEIKETYADSVRANFERACVALGIVGLRFHDLRHTAITNLFAIGLQIQEVSLFSGHKDWTNLKRYTHVSPGDVQRSIARLQFLEEQSRTSKREKSNGINEVSSVFFNRFDSACGESSWAWFGAGLIADSISNAGHELLQ